MSRSSKRSDVFQVSDACRRLGLRAGAIVFRGVRIGPSGAGLQQLIDREIQELSHRFATPAALRSTPEIVKLHSLFRAVGVNPRRVQPACERLIQMGLKQGQLAKINNLVDAYNLISARSICSLGAHDLDKLALPIQLRLLQGSEEFIPMGAREREACATGEFAYVDAAGRVICRLDVRQAEFSKVNPESDSVLLIIGATTALSIPRLEVLFSETTDLITEYCGGTPEIVHFPLED